MAQSTRIVGFIDMDCFYVAVERARNPQLRGVPCAVVQYNTAERNALDALAESSRFRSAKDSMGGIIAVSYEARARGVTRAMSGREAFKVCPEIILVQVPTAFGKADLRIYKKGGDDVVNLLSMRADATEKRSVDEVAIDITSEARRILAQYDWHNEILPQAKKNSHMADSALSRKAAAVSRESTRKGHEGQQKVDTSLAGADFEVESENWQWLERLTRSDKESCQLEMLLVAGAIVVAELRAEVKAKLGFSCSGGIATNKILAKLGCGLHKPDQQTILLPHSVPLLLHDLPLDRLTGLGGQFGESIKSSLGIATVGELLGKPKHEIMKEFPERGNWLLEFAAGKDTAVDVVKDRQLTKSLVNSKTFLGKRTLDTVEKVEHWLHEFAGELHIRYEEQVRLHQRSPTVISVSICLGGSNVRHDQPGQYWDHQANHRETAESHTKQQSIDLGRDGTVKQISTAAKACFRKWHQGLGCKPFQVTSLGLSLTGIIPIGGHKSITSFFKKASNGSSKSYVTTSSKASSNDIANYSIATATEVLEDDRVRFVVGQTVEVHDDMLPVSPRRSISEQSVENKENKGNVSSLQSAIVDESVLAELPWDLQQEIRSHLNQSACHVAPAIRSRAASGTNCTFSGVCDEHTGKRLPVKRRRAEAISTTPVIEITID